MLGRDASDIAESAEMFFQFDEQSVRHMARLRKEKKSNKEYIEAVKQTIENLKTLMSADKTFPTKDPAELPINALN